MSKSRTVNVGLLQSFATPNPEQNLINTAERCHLAAEQDAQIICTQELFRTPYPCQEENHDLFKWAETIPGPSTEALGKVARERKVVIIASLFEKRSAGLYHNTAVVLGPDGQILGTYRKMHIPDDPGYYEKFYFTPGDLGFQVVKTPFADIGLLICWDQWYPEAARLTALKGAEILFYPTAIGWRKDENEGNKKLQFDAWQTIQRSHAIANGVYVVSVNRSGEEDKTKFWGQSFVCDPFGEVLESASAEHEEIITVGCNLDDIDRTRTHWPFLRDRRIDAYQGLDQRYLGKG